MSLRQTISDVLRSDAAVDVSRVHVKIHDKVAVLEGCVPTYADQCRALEIARRAAGTLDIENKLEVRLTIGDYRTDATLERVLRDLIDSLTRMPAERPRVSVTGGWVTLTGEVRWPFQRQLVEEAIRYVAGIRGVTNTIAVVPMVH